jgi:membrane fusion protein (multidrug efflux system)
MMAHTRHGRSLTALAMVLAVGGGLTACNKSEQAPAAAQAGAAAPLPEVVVVVAQNQPVERSIELAGRLRAYQVADVRPQVSGIVQQRLFTEGSMVKAGQALYRIDAASYQSNVNSAKAAVQRAQANLAALQVKAQRYKQLIGINAVSKQEYDDIAAQVALAQADLSASQASLSSSQIDLNRAIVSAPISGQTGTSNVTAGALVTASQSTAMVTIQQLDPLYVDITQSSADLLKLRAQLSSGQLDADGSANVRLTLPDGSTYPQTARLQFSNASVDETTGTVTLRAVVANPRNLLLPGMYVKAQVSQGRLPAAMLIPQQALTRTPQGDASVLVVAQDGSVSQRVVTAAFTQGDKWVVTDGLQEGERIIVAGSQKIRMIPGAPAPKVNAVLQTPESDTPAAPAANAAANPASKTDSKAESETATGMSVTDANTMPHSTTPEITPTAPSAAAPAGDQADRAAAPASSTSGTRPAQS